MNNKKLNTGKAKGGIFRRKSDRPTKQELQELKSYYNRLTAAVSDDEAMKMLDSPEKWHYLMLMKIADHAKMGKTFSILTAFKTGYLYAKGKIELGLPEHYADTAYWVQEYRERTSKILAETENADTLAQIYYFAKRAGKAGRRNDGK